MLRILMIEGLECIAKTDAYWLVNKPVGIAAQGESNSLIARLNLAGHGDFYPVHRLDKVTSGALLVARNATANQTLSGLFEQGQVEKYYLAISDKKPKKKQGTIIGDMEKSRRGTYKLMRSRHNPARTQIASFSLGQGQRLFLLRLLSGKTHQARVALKAIGAPILGDTDYGGTPADRVYLHAWQLGFPWQGVTVNYVAQLVNGQYFLQDQCQHLLDELMRQRKEDWPRALSEP